MAARARDRGSSHGIDGPILETCVGNAGTVLETATREARRREAEIRNVASGAGAVQSRAAGTQEGFPRCRTPGEAAGGPRIGSELCARCRATSVADSYAQEVPVKVRSGAAAEPSGVSFRRCTYQVIQHRLRSVRRQCQADAEGARRR